MLFEFTKSLKRSVSFVLFTVFPHSFQLPGLIKTIQGVQTEREALATLVEETYLKPFKVRRRIHPPVL